MSEQPHTGNTETHVKTSADGKHKAGDIVRILYTYQFVNLKTMLTEGHPVKTKCLIVDFEKGTNHPTIVPLNHHDRYGRRTVHESSVEYTGEHHPTEETATPATDTDKIAKIFEGTGFKLISLKINNRGNKVFTIDIDDRLGTIVRLRDIPLHSIFRNESGRVFQKTSDTTAQLIADESNQLLTSQYPVCNPDLVVTEVIHHSLFPGPSHRQQGNEATYWYRPK